MAKQKSPQALAAERRAEAQRNMNRARAKDNLLEMLGALSGLRRMHETQEQAQALGGRIRELVESDDSYSEAAAELWLEEITPQSNILSDSATEEARDLVAKLR